MKPSILDQIAQNNPIVSELKQELLKFDAPEVGGDGDGVFELTDIDPHQLSQKFNYLSKYFDDNDGLAFKKLTGDSSFDNNINQLTKLRETFLQIREKTNLPPINQSKISSSEIVETFQKLFGEDYVLLAEKTNDAKVRILGDSLTRGMASTSDGGLGDPRNYQMAKILLDAMGIPLEDSLALTQKQAFPYDRTSIDSPGMLGFMKMGMMQVSSLMFAMGSNGDFFPLSSDQLSTDQVDKLIELTEDLSVNEKENRLNESRAVVIGASGSTTADVLSDLKDYSERTASTGRSFIEKNHGDIFKDLKATSVVDMLMKSFSGKSSPDQLRILMIMLGANDLFTIGGMKRIVNAPEQNPIKFREAIQELVDKVASFDLGPNFRPIFLAPFDVSSILSPVPESTKYADQSDIPSPSYVLYHHQLIALEDKFLPPQVVFSKEDVAKMKAWQKEYFQILQEELGFKQGWKVLDLQEIFSTLVSNIQENPILVDQVTGYGKVDYSFRDLFSFDNQHPSPSGYLLLALLQQALLMEAGYALEGYEDFLKNFPKNSQAREPYILNWVEFRFKEIVQQDPSFYRPRRVETKELFDLSDQIKSFDQLDRFDAKVYQSLWPLVSDDTLADLLSLVSDEKFPEELDHHQKVAQLLSAIDQVSDWQKIKSEFNETLSTWAKDYKDHQFEIARNMDLNFKAFGGVSNDDYEGRRFGVIRHTRGLLDIDGSSPIDSDDSLASYRIGLGISLETNSLRLMGLTQNIILDAGLRFGYGTKGNRTAEVMMSGGLATKLGIVQYLQIFNEVKVGANLQIDQTKDLEDVDDQLAITDQIRFLFTISDDLTGRDNSTQALYLGVENLSHFLEITPGYLPPTLSLGANFTYAF